MGFKLFPLYEAIYLAGSYSEASADPVTRYFHHLKPAASQYYDLGVVSLPEEWTATVSFSTTDTTNQVLFGDVHTTNLYVNFSDTDCTVWLSGGFHSYTWGSLTPHDGKYHTLKIVTTTQDIQVFLDDTQISKTNVRAVTPFIGDVNLLVGTSNSVAIRFDGYIGGFSLFSGTEISGHRIYSSEFNTDLTNPYVFEPDVSLDSDEWGSSALTLQSGWTGDNSSISFDGTTTGYVFATDVKGEGYYRVDYTVTGNSSDLRMFVGGNWLTVDGNEGSHSVKIKSNNTADYFRFYSTVGSGAITITNIQIKPIISGSSYVAVNLGVEDAGLFTRETTRWVGDNIVENPQFDVVSDWILGSEWTQDTTNRGSISIVDATSAVVPKITYQNLVRPPKLEWRTSVDITEGGVEFYNGASYVERKTATGEYVFSIKSLNTSSYPYFTFRAIQGTTATVNYVSAHVVLEDA